MTSFKIAELAYQSAGGTLKIDKLTSHYDLKLNIWYLISQQKLIATYCNGKLELI